MTPQQLGWCRRLGVLSRVLCGATADVQRTENAGMEVDTSIELYLAATMVAIVASSLWEAAKSCQRQTTSAVRLRTLEARRDRSCVASRHCSKGLRWF